MSKARTYIAIDLKSFYASVECVERGLNPLTTNLVVADKTRTDKTICLAVSPTLKAYGIGGRARLFEVVQRIKQVNTERQINAPGFRFTGKSYDDPTLRNHPELELDYIAAPPRMAFYIQYSTRIYNIYLRFVSAEDIHVYSIDEVFMDVTDYLDVYKTSAHELTIRIIREVLKETGITATAGIGTNMYLAKVAMDIVAKHIPADEDGVRIAELDEMSYRRQLWGHRPLTDFWRVGHGIARKLEQNELYTMGMVARQSVKNEELLYKLFGVNAELLIDHAWGWEPTTIDLVKQYRPENNSLSSGQVLQSPYPADKARIVVQEMADAISLDMVSKRLVANQVTLTIGYDVESLTDPNRRARYHGPVTLDWYGRPVPPHAHGTASLEGFTSSSSRFINAVLSIFDRTVNKDLLIRRIVIGTYNVINENQNGNEKGMGTKAEQLELFDDYETISQQRETEKVKLSKERRIQETIIDIKQKYGKNALLKGINFEEGATAKERNRQIGGHRS